MKIGDYVRTKNGILQIYKINENATKWKYVYKTKEQDGDGCINVAYLSDYNIIRTSPNILDLIEVGDYVNSFRVLEIVPTKKGIFGFKTYFYNGTYYLKFYSKSEIKSILTHEQYEMGAYKVNE